MANAIGVDDDVWVSLLSYNDPAELARFAQSCSRFGSKRNRGSAPSLAEEAARQSFLRLSSEDDRARLPRHDGESWIELLCHLNALASRLEFIRLIGGAIKHAPRRRGPGVDRSSIATTDSGGYYTAICSRHVMRAGRHHAMFRIPGNWIVHSLVLRVCRPIELHESDVATGSFSPLMNRYDKLLAQKDDRWGDSEVHCCLYRCRGGKRYWTNWEEDEDESRFVLGEDWPGMERLEEAGTIGMLLDLDEGTLSVYKNGRKLGTMMDSLGGEYCWMTSLEWGRVTITRGETYQNKKA